MARPELRQDLRKISDLRNAISVISVWMYVAVLIGGAVWLDNPFGLPRRLHPDGAHVRPVRHPHARSSPQASVHQQADQRLGRDLADRVPDLDSHLDLPAGSFRPPQRGIRPTRTGHRLLRRLPVQSTRPDPTSGSRRGRYLGVEELHAAVQGAPTQGHATGGRVDPRRPSSSVGGHVGRHRTLVDLPTALVAAVDDAVAGDQPAPGDRRARRDAGQSRSAGHHPQRQTKLVWRGSGSSPTTPGGTSPITWTWGSPSATSPPFTPNSNEPGYVTDGITYPNYRSLWRALASA